MYEYLGLLSKLQVLSLLRICSYETGSAAVHSFIDSWKTPRQRPSFLGKFQTIPNNLANIPTHGPNICLFALNFYMFVSVLGH
jgi:hypothetical protein